MKKSYLLVNCLYFLGRSLSRAYAKLLLKRQTYKKNQLPKGAKIFAVNHPSTLDPLYVMGSIKEPVHALLTENVFKIFALNKIISWAGHVKVSDKQGRPAFDRAIELLNKNRSILIFPEGTVSQQSEKVEQLRTGIIRMAIATGAPITPLGVFLDLSNTTVKIRGKAERFVWYRRGAYVISYGQPIYLSGQSDNRTFVKEASLFLQTVLQNLLLRSRQLAKLPVAK